MAEYDDCRRLAQARNLPVKLVYDAALSVAHDQFLASIRPM